MKNAQKNKQATIRERMNGEFLMLTPNALDALRDLINDPDCNPIARVHAIELIMDRGLGKPEESVRILNDEEQMEKARKRLEEIAARIRLEVDSEP